MLSLTLTLLFSAYLGAIIGVYHILNASGVKDNKIEIAFGIPIWSLICIFKLSKEIKQKEMNVSRLRIMYRLLMLFPFTLMDFAHKLFLKEESIGAKARSKKINKKNNNNLTSYSGFKKFYTSEVATACA
ncbi:hypothetical protein [uncultured Veillonella sp.]|uniref:hypothetical protein n=1 Tax=uncultured Veillonella sp. TaxID=159268 RepID=UPI0026218078|nr:hypothetical protein [uncultured Veillonella sp.]